MIYSKSSILKYSFFIVLFYPKKTSQFIEADIKAIELGGSEKNVRWTKLKMSSEELCCMFREG